MTDEIRVLDSSMKRTELERAIRLLLAENLNRSYFQIISTKNHNSIVEKIADFVEEACATATTKSELKGHIDELRILKEHNWSPEVRLQRLTALQEENHGE